MRTIDNHGMALHYFSTPSVLCVLLALPACDSPCPPGSQLIDGLCVRATVPDASTPMHETGSRDRGDRGDRTGQSAGGSAGSGGAGGAGDGIEDGIGNGPVGSQDRDASAPDAGGDGPPDPCSPGCLETAFCHEPTNTCVECLDHDDCPEPNRPACGPDHTCVPCTEDHLAGCMDPDAVCDVNHHCAQCTEADASACVAPSPICDTEAQACVACLDDTTSSCAGETPACDATTQQCVQCTADHDLACTSEAPVCDTNTHQCVQCLDHIDCSGHPGGPYCIDRQCVQCLSDTDCTDPAASRCNSTTHTCEPCDSDADCEGIVDGEALLGVCDTSADLSTGQCVECTGADYAACGQDGEGRHYVCDSLAGRCSEQTEHRQGPCTPCVSDAACELGQRCIQQSQRIGYFCLWEYGSGAGDAPSTCPRPYVERTTPTTSIDGHDAYVCTTLLNCRAHNDFGTTRDGCGIGANDDAACGHPDLNDGLCRLFEEGPPATYQCTTYCGSSNHCPPDHACVFVTGETPYCDLQAGNCYSNDDCPGSICSPFTNLCE